MQPRSMHARAGLGAALRIVQEGGKPLRRVWVEFPALILVRAGRKLLRMGDLSVSAGAGEVVAVGAGSEIEVTNEPPVRGPYMATCLAFDPALWDAAGEFPAGATRWLRVTSLGVPAAPLREAFERAVSSLERPEAMPEAILRHRLQEVLLSLGLLGWRFDLRSLHRVSVRVRRLVGADPARRWSAAAVGRALGMSEATLRRRLSAEGLGFRAILTQVRMGRALALLQASEASVLEIAQAAGYESVSQFTARFRRYFGQSPRHLRDRPAGS